MISVTQAEALKRECEQIMQRSGYYIRPNRMPDIMKAAQKATDAKEE